MPMSFAASLGTTIKLFGAPAFLLADGLLRQAGQPALGIFSIAPIGLVISVVGTLFILLTSRFILPDRPTCDMNGESFRLDGYYAAVASFLTPIGHHGNWLIYGLGHYQFKDFIKVGTPLTFLIAFIVLLMALFLWPLSGS